MPRINNTTRRIIFFNKFAVLTSLAAASGINFMVTCFYRTAKEQKKLFDEGKSQCDGVTKKSSHQKWLAIDLVIIKDGVLQWDRIHEYDTLGSIWKTLGGIWGGSWQSIDDPYHFQYGGE